MSVTQASQEEATIFTVDTLVKYMGGDQKALAVVTKIVRDAVAGAAEPMALATAAVREGRYEQAARYFHGLRGSIGTLGTKRFVNAALALEVAMLEQRGDQLPLLLLGVEREYALAMEQAHAWLAANPVQAAG
ncbi:HPt (histidine-containing phosphotransfer) domain-containing protein [Janthinobacterium sp. CG_23.3]|uniref:Hpt domain-containing protein n=1 Tax=Janthinobacterium sp. CG_23.3 TaxID=3349634 RepID=UPI0038D4D06A